MRLRLTIALCLVAVFAPAAMAQFGFDDESSVSAAVVSDRGFGAASVLKPLEPLHTAIDPVLPVFRP